MKGVMRADGTLWNATPAGHHGPVASREDSFFLGALQGSADSASGSDSLSRTSQSRPSSESDDSDSANELPAAHRSSFRGAGASASHSGSDATPVTPTSAASGMEDHMLVFPRDRTSSMRLTPMQLGAMRSNASDGSASTDSTTDDYSDTEEEEEEEAKVTHGARHTTVRVWDRARDVLTVRHPPPPAPPATEPPRSPVGGTSSISSPSGLAVRQRLQWVGPAPADPLVYAARPPSESPPSTPLGSSPAAHSNGEQAGGSVRAGRAVKTRKRRVRLRRKAAAKTSSTAASAASVKTKASGRGRKPKAVTTRRKTKAVKRRTRGGK